MLALHGNYFKLGHFCRSCGSTSSRRGARASASRSQNAAQRRLSSSKPRILCGELIANTLQQGVVQVCIGCRRPRNLLRRHLPPSPSLSRTLCGQDLEWPCRPCARIRMCSCFCEKTRKRFIVDIFAESTAMVNRHVVKQNARFCIVAVIRTCQSKKSGVVRTATISCERASAHFSDRLTVFVCDDFRGSSLFPENASHQKDLFSS